MKAVPTARLKANRPKNRKPTFRSRKASNHKAAVAIHRTLRGWAISILLDTHAIIECAEHGHIRDRGSWAHGWDEARAVAKSHPFAGATPLACIEAIDDVMASIGDDCPECL